MPPGARGGETVAPVAHSTKLNHNERLNRKIDPHPEADGVFLNEDAIRRLAGAILFEQTDEWAVHRARYMPHDTPSDVPDPSTAELPAPTI